MRYLVYGAGAIGGTIGGRLHQHGHDVVLLARGAHLDALRASGLRLRDPQNDALLDVPAAADPREAGVRAGDVVVLAMKTQDTAPALDALVTSAGPDAPAVSIVCAQNGVENERMALRLFPNVYGMCVMLPASHLEPGVVDVHSAPTAGILDVGRYPTGTDETAERVASDIASSGFLSETVPAIMRRKYTKLLMNLANSLEAACGMRNEEAGPIFERARAEGRACLAAAGIDAASDEEDRARRGEHIRIRPIDGARRQGGSSWQSLARGSGSIEADWLNGEIVLLGRQHGIPTPVNAGLQRIANRMAREGRAPGSMDVADVLAEIEA
jgi:2-dehydropantoate 2-reductase